MANRRTTFGKLQRERDKKEKAVIKAERKAARLESKGEETTTQPGAVDQDAILDALADLHRRFEDDQISIDEFEERREQLTSRLVVD
jgi:molecular chaperone DnaK (HSP70)